MPGPALIITINGDTTALAKSLGQAKSGIAGFAESFTGLLDKTQAIKQIAGDFGELLDFAVGLGGPEAQAAFAGLQTQIGEQLAPVMEKLAPLIIKLIEGFSELVLTVLPPLIDILIPLVDGIVALFDAVAPVVKQLLDDLQPALQVVYEVVGKLFEAIAPLIGQLADSLGPALKTVFDAVINVGKAIGDVVEAINTIWGKFNDLVGGIANLIAKGWDPLWEKIQAIIGIFSGLKDVIDKALEWIKGLLGPIGDVINLVGDLIGDLGEAVGLTHDAAEASQGFSNVSGGGFSVVPGSITINTGADPGAVMRAVRRYQAGNGGPRAFGARGAAVRGW